MSFLAWLLGPRPVAEPLRSDGEILLEALQDQIAYLRAQLRTAHDREQEMRLQLISLADRSAAWNAQAIRERAADTASGGRVVVPGGPDRGVETEGGHFSNSLFGNGHVPLTIEGEEGFERPRVGLTEEELTERTIEQAFRDREAENLRGAGVEVGPAIESVPV